MLKKHVLLVDDNVTVRSLERHLFELEPEFEVSGEAENGLEGVEKAENLKPDLVIMDLSMPVMSGFEAASQIRKILPDAKIILFTVHEGDEVERKAREAGIHAVVSKNQPASRLVLQAQALLASFEEERASGKLRDAS
jgi:two-component system nitrate/nitrite response regulator NarL